MINFDIGLSVIVYFVVFGIFKLVGVLLILIESKLKFIGGCLIKSIWFFFRFRFIVWFINILVLVNLVRESRLMWYWLKLYKFVIYFGNILE